MTCFLSIAMTAIAVLASQALGSLASSVSTQRQEGSPFDAMSRELTEQSLSVEFGHLRGLSSIFKAKGLPFTMTEPGSAEASITRQGLARNNYVMTEPCTLCRMEIEYEEPIETQRHSVWECLLDPVDADGIEGIFVSFEGLDLPMNAKDNDQNPLISGVSTLFANGIQINHGQAKARFPHGVHPGFGRRPRRYRHLAAVTGDKPVLAVRVIGADAQTTYSTAEISDSIFGTDGDPVNIKSQYAACSFGQLNITPAVAWGQGVGVVNGVVTVTIPNTISGADRGVIANAVTSALNAAGFSTPGQAQHIMYCLPPGTTGSWIAYAYIDSWLSVYNNQWCTYVSGQMHEIGHNLNLGHSGESSTYDDKSGMMGFSYSSDDGPEMCFNAAKSWQLRWYEDKHASVNPLQAGWEGDMVGIVDYNRASNERVLLQLDVPGSTTDYYINYNRATGFNSGTQEGGNQVLVTSQGGGGTGYSASLLLSKMNAGGSYVISNFGGTSESVTIEFVSIDSTGPYHIARVRVWRPTANPTAPPTPPPTPVPVDPFTSAPTPNPSGSPTPPPTPNPTPAPVVTSTPTSNPTPAPVTVSTSPPTPNPTTAPPIPPATPGPTSSPTPAPTPAPTSTPSLAPNPTPAPVVTSTPTSNPTPAPVTVSTSPPTPNPTTAPPIPPATPGPTPNPTPAPTPAPTSSCKDTDGSFLFQGRQRTCLWLQGRSSGRRSTICAEVLGASDVCPLTCGVCS